MARRPRIEPLVAACALAALAALAVPAASAAQAKPDILLVLTDDQRWDSLDVMPTVTAELVAKGVTFENAFAVNPVCCPSRASILTGLHSHSTLVYTNGGTWGGYAWFDDSSTVATWLSRAGYRTGYVGKYLNGYVAPDVPPGWDRWVAYQSGFFGYRASFDGIHWTFGFAPEEYSTDVFTREAVDFVATAGDEPLFLVYAPFAPHDPATPAPRHTSAFPDWTPFRPPAYDEEDVSDKPRWVRRTPRITPERARAMDALAKRMQQSLLAVDEGVGALVDALDEAGRLANTLLVFTSDNGLLWGEHRRANAKVAPYEESIRVPLVVRWDALGHGRRNVSRIAANLDLAPTFAEVAGARRPRVEGRSLLPLLSGGETSWRTSVLLEHLNAGNLLRHGIPTYCGVRAARWKYVAYASKEEELYDLASDPDELTNLVRAPAQRDRVLELRRELRRLCAPPPPGFSLAWLCTHETTADRRVARGTMRADTLCGQGGGDRLLGRGRNDVLRGRGGNDLLRGGGGADRLDGGRGRDRLEGGSGNDRVVGGSGRDRMSGGSGTDRIDAREGVRDTVACGLGRDVVHADRKDRVAGDCEVVRVPGRR